MVTGKGWVRVMVASYFLFCAAVPLVHSESASCQGESGETLECVDVSTAGALSESNCGGNKKFVKSPCPTENVIAMCTYEMGMSSGIGVVPGEGLQFGAVQAVKYQVNCYSDKSGNDEKRLEACKEQCRSLEGSFSTNVEQKK